MDYNRGAHRAPPRETHSTHNQLSYDRNQRHYPSQRMEYRLISPSRRSCNLLQVNASNSSRTPPIAPLRDPITTPPALDRGEVNSHSSGRRSAKERLELPPHTCAQPVNLSADRRSALERIGLPPSQDPARSGGLSNSMIARLQDVEPPDKHQKGKLPLEELLHKAFLREAGGVQQEVLQLGEPQLQLEEPQPEESRGQE
ncbi:hypothetical protein DY000_02037127 [Brassica cretica]|uniref:DUF3741 domain-containing protein n=1 Tax=Brassica cretica TaxID=69181 RepID=A0ABQ7BRG7_BRACR|nr:hypothetical protein DY000_02037127 [Brassica cretica]